MTDTRIDEIRERWEKATPGPWAVQHNDLGYVDRIFAPHQDRHKPGGIYDITRGAAISMPSSEEGEANASAIAHAPEDIACLLSIIDEQKARIDRLEKKKGTQPISGPYAGRPYDEGRRGRPSRWANLPHFMSGPGKL